MDIDNIPKHIAIIMDGNRRWAKKRGMLKSMGHREGAKTLKTIVEDASDIGIKYLTVYAFSTENWKREKEEVDTLMNLLREFLDECIKKFSEGEYVIKFIGEIKRLDRDIREKICRVVESTKDNKGMTLNIALNYGGRDDLVRGFKKVAKKVYDNELSVDDICENVISHSLDTNGIPDPDLVIRTSGEKRVSNFLLWQLAYSEFYFEDKYWPDFNKKDLLKAISSLQKRNRRFGGV